MAQKLDGKVAAITGAASGIGLASAEAMLAQGATVVFVDRDKAALDQLAAKHGAKAIPLVIDLVDREGCASLLGGVLDKAGQLDILHANAGTYIGGDLIEAELDSIDLMLSLTVNTVMKNVRSIIPHMMEPWDWRHHRDVIGRGTYGRSVGAGLFRFKMGDDLIRANDAATVE